MLALWRRNLPVGLKDEGRQIDVSLRAEPARIGRWHGRLHVADQIAGRPSTPSVHEIGPSQLRSFAAASQIRPMATGAVGLINRLTLCGLLGGESDHATGGDCRD